MLILQYKMKILQYKMIILQYKMIILQHKMLILQYKMLILQGNGFASFGTANYNRNAIFWGNFLLKFGDHGEFALKNDDFLLKNG